MVGMIASGRLGVPAATGGAGRQAGPYGMKKKDVVVRDKDPIRKRGTGSADSVAGLAPTTMTTCRVQQAGDGAARRRMDDVAPAAIAHKAGGAAQGHVRCRAAVQERCRPGLVRSPSSPHNPRV